jgi:hypothetical protein
MAIAPEVEKPRSVFSEEPKAQEIPPEVERVPGITPPPAQPQPQATPQQPPAQPQDQTATPQVSVQVSNSDEELLKMSKGSTEESSTWLGTFLIRLVKKAIHFGWKIIRGGN